MKNPLPASDSLGLEGLLARALKGDDAEFLQVTRLCEDEGIASRLLPALRARRSQLDGWIGYLAELHPSNASRVGEGT
jgi:hypothetical protein